jgi:RimJ/RimL family protein N-acetyltransferase
LIIRTARIEDSVTLFEWRNDPVTRNSSLNTSIIDWTDHKKWFLDVLNNPNIDIFIAEESTGVPPQLGMCRFNISDDAASAEVSINLNPEYRGKGLAQEILHASVEFFKGQHPTICRLTATIRAENQPSMKIFLAENFVSQGLKDGVVRLELKIEI